MSLLTTTISPSIVNQDEIFNKISPKIKDIKILTKNDNFLSKYIKQNHIRTKLNDHTFVQVDQCINQYLLNNTLHVDVVKQKLVERNIKLNVKYQPVVVKSIPVETSDDLTVNKVLPPDYMDCLLSDLINLTSRMLLSLINLNDKSVPKAISNPKPNHNSTLLTRYHSRSPPQISINSYLSRLCKFNNFNCATLLTTIYYIDLLSYHYKPYFTLNSWTIHRFLLVASMVSQKCMEDFFFTNDHYAKVGGVNIDELNCLELDFLYRVNWKCIPVKNINEKVSTIKFSNDVLLLYYKNLIGLMGSELQLSDNIAYTLDGHECVNGDQQEHEHEQEQEQEQEQNGHSTVDRENHHDNVNHGQNEKLNGTSGKSNGEVPSNGHPCVNNTLDHNSDESDYDDDDDYDEQDHEEHDDDYADCDNIDNHNNNNNNNNKQINLHFEKSNQINHIEESQDKYVGYDIENGSSPHLKRHYSSFE